MDASLIINILALCFFGGILFEAGRAAYKVVEIWLYETNEDEETG